MKTRVLIVDDEPLARDVIHVLLEAHPDIEIVGACANGHEAVEAIRTQGLDLVFLDVQMPDLDGCGVIGQVGVATMPVVIFVTAYDQYALQAFAVHALDYLLKPFDKERFDYALRHALQQVEHRRAGTISQRLHTLLEDYEGNQQTATTTYTERLVLKEAGRIFFLPVDEIDWIEAAGDYVGLHVGRKKHLLHETMNGLEAKLNPERFLRIHRSTIVNIDRIKELLPHFNGEYFVVLRNSTRLKLSRSYRDRLQRLLGSAP